jgi:hypothetical protein
MAERSKAGRKPGRPKGKPLSAKERAQRRAAPLKTGEHAQTALGQALPPCKPAVCPNDGKGTCEVKTAVEKAGGGLSSCLVSLGHQDTIAAFAQAIENGDIKGLRDLTAASLAGQTVLAHSQLQELIREGLVVDFPIIGKNQDGEVEIVGSRPVENPRAAQTLKLLQQLGHTAQDQAITPKSQGERNRDEGLGQAGHAAFITRMRQQLAGGLHGEEGE